MTTRRFDGKLTRSLIGTGSVTTIGAIAETETMKGTCTVAGIGPVAIPASGTLIPF